MGFLKFLKKRQIEEDLLDIPPLPPLTEEGEELGLTSLQEERGIPPPPIELGSVKAGVEIPETEDISLISRLPQPEYIKQSLQEEKPVIWGKQKEPPGETKKSSFINILQYKKILEHLSLSKSDARLAEDRILAVNQSNELKDKHIAKLKSVFEDIQKKLIIVDRILSG